MNMQTIIRPPEASVILDLRGSSPAGQLAGMLDMLARCVTDHQLRAWLSATYDFRARLPEMVLERVERERRAQDHRPSLLSEIGAAARKHGMTETTFGRRALRDPSLVGDLRRGRRLHDKTEAKVRAFMAALDRGEGC